MVYVYLQAEMPDNIKNVGEAATELAEKVKGKLIMLSSDPSEDYEFRSIKNRDLQSPTFKELTEKCLRGEPFDVAGFTVVPKEEDALTFKLLDTIVNEEPEMNPEDVVGQLMNTIWYVQTKAMECISDEARHLQEVEELAESSTEEDFVPLSDVAGDEEP